MASCHPSYSSLSSSPSSPPKRSHFPSFAARKPSGGSRSATRASSTSLPVQKSNVKSPPGISIAASPNTLDHHHPNGAETNYTHASNPKTQQSATSTGSGIPSFRSLRSLLPFSNAFKHQQPHPQMAPEHSTPSKSPFAGFGSMRKSMNLTREKEKEPRRERKMSLASDLPFITIERKPLERADDVDGPLRRSMSLPGMEAPGRIDLEKPLPSISSDNFISNSHSEDGLKVDRLLRTPSPGPPLPAELSTIVEADSSGISKHIPSHSPFTDSSSSLPTSPHRIPEQDTIRQPVPSHSPIAHSITSLPLDPSIPVNVNPSRAHSPHHFAATGEADADLGLELSTSQLASQVQDAMARTSWSGSDGPVMIDAETSFVQIDHQDHSDIERDEIDFSLLAQAGSPSPSPSPSTPSFPPEPPADDDTSHINNSLSSVVNPNELCSSSAVRGEQHMTLDLESLDPDLRDAVTRRAHQSPTHSSTSGRTVTLSSPQSLRPSPITQRQSSTAGFRYPSTSSVLATSTKHKSHSSSIPHSKRRVTSSFLPRLRSSPHSTTVHSAPASARNSSSPQKIAFERIRNMDSVSSPKSPVFIAPQAIGSINLANNSVGSNVRGVLTTSTPARARAEKSLAPRGHTRISSVPTMSRVSPKDSAQCVEAEEALGPEVMIIEASAEFDNGSPLEWSNDKHRLGVGRWSSQNSLHHEAAHIVKSEPDDERDANILGSPFQTSAECAMLGHGPSHTPSYSPCPSPTLHPPSTFHRATTPKLNDGLSITDDSSSTPINFITTSSSGPYPPPQRVASASLLPPGDFTGNASPCEGSPSKVADPGSPNGRNRRPTQAPPKLFCGNGDQSGGSREEARELTTLADRQPSPLRIVFRSNNCEDDEIDGGRPSIDDTTAVLSVRHSLDSGRPSLDSYPGSSTSRRSLEPRYYGSNESSISRPPTRLRDREGLLGRIRKRSVGPPEYSGEEDSPRDLLSPSSHAGNLSSAAISARERLARARYGDLGGGSRPWSSMSLRSGRPETLFGGGSRKRAGEASSVIYMRERDRSPGGIERSSSERTGERERDITIYRERSGSASALGGGIGTLGRYASLRTTSECNFGAMGSSTVDLVSQRHHPTRAFSRMSFSEFGSGSGHGRRDSVTYSAAGHGLMESPISTVSTNVTGSARDTARSTSTGATSVSQSPLGNAREREELRELKEKHTVETGALLNALSDSQRACKVLREENGELRERIMELERENERLKVMFGESEQEVERLKVLREQDRERKWLKERETSDRRGVLSMSVRNGTIASWRNSATQRDFTLGPRTFVRQKELNSFNASDEAQLTKSQSRSKLENVLFSRGAEHNRSSDPQSSSPEMDFENQGQFSNRLLDEHPVVANAREDIPDDAPVLSPTISSTPSQSTVHNRRPSTSSSIFPVPPPNMTMLLHDESTMFQLSDSRRNSAEINPLHSFKLPPGANGSSILPVHPSRREGLPTTNTSSSNMSISPENLSLVTSGTGSPGSLFLRPEHEMMLDEMESLDLSRYREEVEGNEA